MFQFLTSSWASFIDNPWQDAVLLCLTPLFGVSVALLYSTFKRL